MFGFINSSSSTNTTVQSWTNSFNNTQSWTQTLENLGNTTVNVGAQDEKNTWLTLAAVAGLVLALLFVTVRKK